MAVSSTSSGLVPNMKTPLSPKTVSLPPSWEFLHLFCPWGQGCDTETGKAGELFSPKKARQARTGNRPKLRLACSGTILRSHFLCFGSSFLRTTALVHLYCIVRSQKHEPKFDAKPL